MHRKAVLGFTAALACGIVLAGASAASADRDSDAKGQAGVGVAAARFTGLDAIGLTTDQRLVSFRVDLPRLTRTTGTVSGLEGDGALVGIDYRVANGLL